MHRLRHQRGAGKKRTFNNGIRIIRKKEVGRGKLEDAPGLGKVISSINTFKYRGNLHTTALRKVRPDGKSL